MPPPSWPGKKPQRPVSQLPSITEESRQSSPTGKNPQQQPPTGHPTQSSPKGKTHQDLPSRPTEQPVQSTSGFKLPMWPASQRPLAEGTTHSTAESRIPQEQPTRSVSEGKKPQRPALHQPPAQRTPQSSSKGKKPKGPPVQQPLGIEELMQSGFDFGHPLRPAFQRLSTEETTQSASESKSSQKQPSRQPQTEQQPIRSVSEGSKESQEPTPHQSPAEETTQSSSKGKQPMRPSTIQPIGAKPKPKREKCRHKSLEKEMEAALEELEDYSEHKARHGTRDEQPSPEPAGKGAAQGKKAKGKQPMPKEEFGNPKRFIARIPVKEKSSIKRVLVSIGPSTAFRHPQTFLFKNIPCVEPYWGYLNDPAFTAQRIVRLFNAQGATPYFLLACRGEHPKVKSPRNDNAVFAGLFEPIFNDAFVFKLGQPEVYEDGYAKYVNIEEDIGSLDWLPQAIKDAAKKVEFATASNANPGFPDMDNYADKATMLKDNRRMFDWMNAVRKAEIRYGNGIMAGETTSELPGIERMVTVFEQWAAQIAAWRLEKALYFGEDSERPEFRAVQDFIPKSHDAMEAIQAAIALKTATASTIIEPTDTKLTDAVEKANNSFITVRDVYFEIEAIANKHVAEQASSIATGTETNWVIDVNRLQTTIEAMEVDIEGWKERNRFPPDFDTKIVDDFALKLRAVVFALEQRMPGAEVMRLAKELKEGHDFMMAAAKKVGDKLV